MFCTNCGANIDDRADVCVHCGVLTRSKVAVADPLDNATARFCLPVGRSGYAIAAGYLGLFSLVPFPSFNILAIIFGILALRAIARNPKLHGKGRAWFGIVMGTISLVLCLIPILAACLS